MSASERQIAANRRNAARSTGPRSDAGKRASSQNARKHGLLAKQVVAYCEDEGEFLELVEDLHHQFDPQTPVEAELLRNLAIAFWRSRRLAIAERFDVEAIAEPSPLDEHLAAAARQRSASGVIPIEQRLLIGRYQVMVTNEISRLLRLLRQERDLRAKTIEAEALASDERQVTLHSSRRQR